MSDIWIAVFDGKPTCDPLPHPDSPFGTTDENFAGWVRVTTSTFSPHGAGTQREIGLQAVRAIAQARQPLPVEEDDA